MRFSLPLFLLMAFVLGGSFVQKPVHKPNKVSEAADPYVWDFKEVKEGQVLEHTFVLTNGTAKDLIIKDINTSCGCTASKADKMILEPAESTSVNVTFKSKGYSGPVSQFVYIRTDNLDNEIIRLTVKAIVLKD